MSIARTLKSGLAEAKRTGAKQVELQHFSKDEVDELATETLAFLRSRPGRPSSTSGWTAVTGANAKVIPWWAGAAGLTTESQRRSLRTLRRQVYDLLDERGAIVKPVSPNAVVDVSPVGEAEAAPTKRTKATASKAGASKAKASKAAKPEAEKAKATKATKARASKAQASKAPKPEAEKAKASRSIEAETLKPEAESAKGPKAQAAPDGVGAWMLRVDPGVWDLHRFIADGNHEVRAWAVEDNDRSAEMTHGQRVYLWAGGDGTLIAAGVWGTGWVVGPCHWTSVADGYWVDPSGNSRLGLFADVSIRFLPHPVGREQVMGDPRLAAMEVLRDPLVSNPSSLTPDEAVAMLGLVGVDPPQPAEGAG